jgi:hypothetical protein
LAIGVLEAAQVVCFAVRINDPLGGIRGIPIHGIAGSDGSVGECAIYLTSPSFGESQLVHCIAPPPLPKHSLMHSALPMPPTVIVSTTTVAASIVAIPFILSPPRRADKFLNLDRAVCLVVLVTFLQQDRSVCLPE